MELESEVKDRKALRARLPFGAAGPRYQAAGHEHGLLSGFLKELGDRTGVPVLVNTSFKGFCAPIAYSPHDAVRNFYGTGIDVLAIGNFLVHKVSNGASPVLLDASARACRSQS